MTTQKAIRESFWNFLKETAPELAKMKRARKTQNDYCTDIRCMFVEYLYNLHKSGQISEKMAEKTTL